MEAPTRFAVALDLPTRQTIYLWYIKPGTRTRQWAQARWAYLSTPEKIKTWATREGAEGYLNKHRTTLGEFATVAQIGPLS